MEETTPLEPPAIEYKYYAPGIGMIRDGPLEVVDFGEGGNESGTSPGGPGDGHSALESRFVTLITVLRLGVQDNAANLH